MKNLTNVKLKLDISSKMNEYKIIEYKGKKIIFFVGKELFPADNSLKKLFSIIDEFNIEKSIIALPDLHFKIKNFVPSGMVIPLQSQFSYLLLGPNNDGIGGLRIRLNKRIINREEIEKIFYEIKKRVVLFRRKNEIVSSSEAEEILTNGIRDILSSFNFPNDQQKNFEDQGSYLINKDLFKELINFTKKRKPKTLPDFIPNTDLIDRAKKTLCVLDGTSHFIELYRLGKVYDYNHLKQFSIEENDLFFIVHAGGGDVSILLHRIFLEMRKSYELSDDMGRLAFEGIKVSSNFGFANRLFIYKTIRESIAKYLREFNAEIIFDAPHDFLEMKDSSFFIHRKGAIKLIPKKNWGEGNFGKFYILPTHPGGKAYIIWKNNNNPFSMNYMSHGAGRKIRKDLAIKKYDAIDAEKLIGEKIFLLRYGFDSIEGQHPESFKDENSFVETIKRFDLANISAELIPLASLKT